MGVTSLWQIVNPCARPIKIDTLNKKRLSVDASIWVYHFLKAVRDKEGNALRNSHIVGFYRRICKLLYFGIKPVFVFDGGAPALKRQTITGRKNRREGRREDAARTAGKLLALQMQKRAEEEEHRHVETEQRNDDEEAVPENPVYVDELNMTQQERQQSRKFKKKDQYHLPNLDVPLAGMGGPNDPRVMSLEELQLYAKQFEQGEDINVYDFSKIDFDSPFFTSLPATDRYNILNAARLRSRLRMGYSREQLDEMFPDRMAFSRFQIDRVRERNELTQRLMVVGTPEDGTFGTDGTGRVAGEKGREYVLVKNPGVEGGWALGVIGDQDKEGADSTRPIDIDEAERRELQAKRDAEESSAEENDAVDEWNEALKKREAFYKSRRVVENAPAPSDNPSDTGGEAPANEVEDEDGLFVAEPTQNGSDQVQRESSDETDEGDEESQLQLAIAMSMEASEGTKRLTKLDRAEKAQRKAPEGRKFAGSRGRFSNLANRQAQQAMAKGRPMVDEESSDDDNMDLQTALAASRAPKEQLQASKPAEDGSQPTPRPDPPKQKFSGPLPFEKLDLGTSLLGKSKMQKIQDETAGGFERDDEDTKRQKKQFAPAPPWFSADASKGIDLQRETINKEKKQDEEAANQDDPNFAPQPSLRRKRSHEIIDVDAMDEPSKKPAFVDLDPSDEETAAPEIFEIAKEDDEIRMGDLADAVRAEPPEPDTTANRPTEDDVDPRLFAKKSHPFYTPNSDAGESKLDTRLIDKKTSESKEDDAVDSRSDFKKTRSPSVNEAEPVADTTALVKQPTPIPTPQPKPLLVNPFNDESDEDGSDEEVEWSESDHEQAKPKATVENAPAEETAVQQESHDEVEAQDASEGEEEDENADVYIPSEDQLKVMAGEKSPPRASSPEQEPLDASTIPMSGVANQNASADIDMIDGDGDEEQEFSDLEDEELLADLANEAEEHARFASNFNNRTQQQNIEQYERELKALRSQQKKDRRDADEVTQVMIQECQQLLKLFGLPYITAPMEAEAQCAELVQLGLVDGIVTDDSDIFLFGGTRVYKNMFNQAQSVECYLTSDLERDFDLSRDKLIAIAHLLGSDYTEGLHGVGPVNAIEILTEFPDGLDGFRDWFLAIQRGAPLSAADRASPFRKKFYKQAGKMLLPPSFPDKRVELAYTHPEVDSDPSPFQWGVPDLPALRAFLMSTIGWDQARTDEVLVPVIRDMNRRETEGTQANITAFLGAGGVGAGAFAPRLRAGGRSRRMETALEHMAERARAKRRARAVPDVDPVLDGSADAVIARPGSVFDGPEGERVVAARKRHWSRKDIVALPEHEGNDDEGGAEEEDGEEDAEPIQPGHKRKTGRTKPPTAKGKKLGTSKRRRVD